MSLTALRCRQCERTHPIGPLSECDACHGPLDLDYAWADPPVRAESPAMTPLVGGGRLAEMLGVDLHLKLEGANPTHSYKDRIAASAVAAAEKFGFQTLCCASTGNLGEALAARCAAAGLEAIVLCPSEEAQHLPAAAYGAQVFGVRGTFDDCRRLERELDALLPWGFVDGNLHAFAAEGAKSMAYELAEQLGWRFPDAVVVPVASGTLFAKLAQGLAELAELGLVEGPRPRLYGAQAGGCPPLADAWAEDRPPSRVRPATRVRSLAIGDPVYGELAVGAAQISGGGIQAVPEDRIGSATAFLAESTGVFADSAGGVAVEALVSLIRTGAIREGERVVLVVTGTGLKPYGHEQVAEPREIEPELDALLAALGLEN